jgi:hypothetical protein
MRRIGRDNRIPEGHEVDQRRFDSLTKSLAAPKTRRGLLGGLAALVVGARAASATVSPCPVPGQTLNRKGQCVCPAGTAPCPGIGCVDTRRDTDNCGACGNVCPFGEVCQKGECRQGSCTPNFVYCTEGATVCCEGGLSGCYLRTDCGPNRNEDGVCC